MTRNASQITATNLRERLLLAGKSDELDELATVLNELATVLNDMLDWLGGSLRDMGPFSSAAEELPVLYTIWRYRQLQRSRLTATPLESVVGALPAWPRG